jgi:membrane fusion protein, multidrug efflux system
MSPDTPPPDPNTEPAPMSRNKKIVWTAIVLAVVVGVGFIVHERIVSQRGGSGFVNPALRAGFAAPLAVGIAKVTRGDVPITIDSLGTVTPLATVSIHPQVTGPLVHINFVEGQMVKKGEVLAEIDPRPFEATVEQDQAQLQHDQALLNNANVDLERYKMLVATNSVAEQTYATQQATVLQDQATVAADKATLDSAKLNLSYCRITAPVDGSVGLRQVDVGNVVSAYSSTIAVVTQLHPMSVLFTIPEDDLSQVLGRLRQNTKLPAVAYDRTFTTVLDTGELSFADNQVDPTTGTLKLRALFNNSSLQLFPQQFVNVRLTLDTLRDQILVPASAVQTGSSGSYVYVVDENATSAPFDDPPGAAAGAGAVNGQARRGGFGGRRGFGRRRGGAGNFAAAAGPVHIVHLVYVTTGPSTGDMTSIRSGLSVGQTVVVDGAEQLKDGAPVTTPGLDQPAGANPSTAAGSPQPGVVGAAGADASQAPGAAGAGSPGTGPQGGRGAGLGYGYGGNGGRAHFGGGHRRGPAAGAPAGAAGSRAQGSPGAGAAPGAQPASQP